MLESVAYAIDTFAEIPPIPALRTIAYAFVRPSAWISSLLSAVRLPPVPPAFAILEEPLIATAKFSATATIPAAEPVITVVRDSVSYGLSVVPAFTVMSAACTVAPVTSIRASFSLLIWATATVAPTLAAPPSTEVT